MPIDVFCTQCFQHYRIGEQLEGKQAVCKKCKASFPVTAEDPADSAAPPKIVRQRNLHQLGASHPAGIEVGMLDQITRDWILPAAGGVATLISLLLLLIEPWYAIVGAFVALYFFRTAYDTYRERAQHLLSGNLTPGLVMQSDPCIVAYYADMTSDGVRYAPVIKVNYQSGCAGVYEVGERVVAASMYIPDTEPGRPHLDLKPQLINIWPMDQAALKLAYRRIPIRCWAALMRGVQLLPPDYEPGLYRIELPAEIYRE